MGHSAARRRIDRPATAARWWDISWVIPTMLLVGLATGRWWAIPLGGFAWATLVAIAVSIAPGDVPFAAALGAANVAVGVLFRSAVVWLARRVVRLTRLARAA